MSEAAVISRGIAQGNPSSAGSVLIVDDEAEIRESLQTLLEIEGFEVDTALSGEEGLAQMAERPFDLVLLDLTLPGRNGMEILSEIRAHDPRLPVIMRTRYGRCNRAQRTLFKSHGTTRNCWRMFAPRLAGGGRKKRTFNSNAH